MFLAAVLDLVRNDEEVAALLSIKTMEFWKNAAKVPMTQINRELEGNKEFREMCLSKLQLESDLWCKFPDDYVLYKALSGRIHNPRTMNVYINTDFNPDLKKFIIRLCEKFAKAPILFERYVAAPGEDVTMELYDAKEDEDDE